MSNVFDDISMHLPPYLSAEKKRDLFREIDKFPNINYFRFKPDANELLQGDGWSGFTIIDFTTGKKKQVKGVILSNSCDIDITNSRVTPVNIIFAPLVKLENYVQQLHTNGVDGNAVSQKIEAIQKQHVTSIMYFPKIENTDSEYIINFDDIRTLPLNIFMQSEKNPLFMLSQAGFYVLLLKISIHFCRFQERVNR